MALMVLNSDPLELLVIVGMPGSGKTTYANYLVQQGVIDGFCDDYEYGPINERNPVFGPKDQLLLDALRQSRKWAVADTRFCDPRERRKLHKALKEIFPKLTLTYRYFENNPDLCVHNATVRKGSLPRHEINLIYYYTALYEIPDGASVMQICKAQPGHASLKTAQFAVDGVLP